MLVKQRYNDRLKRIAILVMVVLFSMSSLLFALDGRVMAFAGIGTGTAEDPYQITSCAEWQEINDELSAHYILMNDIDCSAEGNAVTIGDQILAFTGVLDGNNNRVTIEIDDTAFPYDVAGLFNYLGGEVRNLEIEGSIRTQSTTGALAGYAEYSTVDNVHITADVVGTNTHSSVGVGGMIGEAHNTTITNSSVVADVNGVSIAGGIIGYAANSTLSDIRITGNVTGNYYAGGAVGELNESSLTRVGVSGAITADYAAGGLVGFVPGAQLISQSYAKGSVYGGDTAGGLIGDFWGQREIVDSYALNDVSSAGTAGGIAGFTTSYNILTNVYAAGMVTGDLTRGLVGSTGQTCTDSFWDARDGSSPENSGCIEYGATSMQPTAQMKNKFTYTANPNRVDAWDFNAIWGINPAENDGYPFLRWEGYTHDAPRDQDSVDDAVEDAAPNNGDGNYNEVPDAEEGNVVSLPSADPAKYITLTLNEDSCYFTSVSVDPEEDMPVQDSAYHYPGGIVSFTVQCPSPGMELTVSIFYFDFDFSDTAEVRKFNTNSETYSTINDTVHVNRVGSTKFHFSSYTIEDGGPLDMDGTANGVIVDPVAIGQKVAENNLGNQNEANTVTAEPNVLSDTGANLIFIILSAFGIIFISALFMAVSRQNNSKLHS